jgi:hypothetical protein
MRSINFQSTILSIDRLCIFQKVQIFSKLYAIQIESWVIWIEMESDQLCLCGPNWFLMVSFVNPNPIYMDLGLDMLLLGVSNFLRCITLISCVFSFLWCTFSGLQFRKLVFLLFFLCSSCSILGFNFFYVIQIFLV